MNRKNPIKTKKGFKLQLHMLKTKMKRKKKEKRDLHHKLSDNRT